MQPQNKGPGMLWGQSYVLPMTWGGGGIWGPLSVDMQPYGCFIENGDFSDGLSEKLLLAVQG